MPASVHHQKEEGEEEETMVIVARQKPTFGASIRDALLEMFPINSTAEVEDVHSGGWAVPIVIITKVAFLVVLIYYTVANTQKEVAKKFLSLSGTSDAQICTTVNNPLTATFLGDIFGHWQSSPDFVQSGGFYKLLFSGSEINTPQYDTAMMAFRDNLINVGEKSLRRGFGFSLIALASWQVSNKSTRMKLTTNAEAKLMMSNFEFISGGVYSATGQARNVPGAAGGGVSGYSFSMSGDYKYMSFSFPLSQCTQDSQNAMVASGNKIKIMSFTGRLQGQYLAVTTSESSFRGDTTSSLYVDDTNPLNVIVSTGKVVDGMLLSFTDASEPPLTYPNQDGTFQLFNCKVGTALAVITIAGTCNMKWTGTTATPSVTIDYNTVIKATSSVTSMTADLPGKAVIAGDGIAMGVKTTRCLSGANVAVFAGGTGGTSSATLTVASTTRGKVANGMTITGTGITVTGTGITLSGCSITAGAGTCTMSSAQTIAASTTITGSVMEAAEVIGGTGGALSLTLSVASTTSTTALANGMTITGTGITGTVTLSGCSITAGAGTCTMSSAQTIAASTTITGTLPNTCAATGGLHGSGNDVLLQTSTSGTFGLNRDVTSDTMQMMALGSSDGDCIQVRKGVPGYFDPEYFSPKYNFGYTNRDSNRNTLVVDFDINSVFTALSVNYGIVPVDALVQVNISNPKAYTVDPGTAFYVDDNNLPMQPVYCVASSTCLVVVKNTYFYPVLFAFDDVAGKPCKCSAPGVPDSSDTTRGICEVSPTLVLALIMFPDTILTDGTRVDQSGNEKIVKFALTMDAKFLAAGGASGNGDFAVRDTFKTPVQNVFKNDYDDVSPPKITGFEDMCSIADNDDKNCVMFLSNFEVNPDEFLSMNNINLQFTALQKSSELYSQPLIAPDLAGPAFQKCQATLLTAIPAALGAAAGSAALYSGVLLSLLLTVALTYINARLAKSKRDPVLPPLQKAKKQRRDVEQSLRTLQMCIPKLIRELPIDAARKEVLIREFIDSYRPLSVTEERVPLQQAKLLKLASVGAEAEAGAIEEPASATGAGAANANQWKAASAKEP